jgi:molybdopterin synthase sulfur carrier subunit
MIFQFSGALLRFVNYERSVQIDAEDLKSALRGLEQRHPSVQNLLCDSEGRIRRAYRVFVNDEQLPEPSDMVPLAQSDRVEILTAIAGG